MIASLILCGGLGTRLRARVADRPKALAPVRGRPLLAYQLDWLAANGICDVTLAAGYLGDQIEEFVRDWRDDRLALTVVRESEPLGSGGAIVNAVKAREINADRLIVLNGDTLLDFDTAPLFRQHMDTSAKGTLVVNEVDDIARFGTVDLVGNQVCGFHQPSGLHEPGVVNAGAYVLEYAQITSLPDEPFSMERDCFPKMAAEARLFAYRLPSGLSFFDIGTPEAFDLINRMG
jgi:D-glycero-alpha-D-manno-heptose 1-phosphate guanylyltransferase